MTGSDPPTFEIFKPPVMAKYRPKNPGEKINYYTYDYYTYTYRHIFTVLFLHDEYATFTFYCMYIIDVWIFFFWKTIEAFFAYYLFTIM